MQDPPIDSQSADTRIYSSNHHSDKTEANASSQQKLTQISADFPIINSNFPPNPVLKVNYAIVSDEYMNDAGYEVWFDPGNKDVFICDEGAKVARVTSIGIINVSSGVRLPLEDWGFEFDYQMDVWSANILAEIAWIKAQKAQQLKIITPKANNHEIKDKIMGKEIDVLVPMEKVKRTRAQSEAPIETPNVNPEQPELMNELQKQFEISTKKYAFYDSETDEKVAIRVGKLMEGVVQQSVKDFDPLAYRVDTLDKKALFDKLKVK
ncbi:MAG: hypothetical protein EZS28_050265, partial [Streblomastix strix]